MHDCYYSINGQYMCQQNKNISSILLENKMITIERFGEGSTCDLTKPQSCGDNLSCTQCGNINNNSLVHRDSVFACLPPNKKC